MTWPEESEKKKFTQFEEKWCLEVYPMKKKDPITKWTDYLWPYKEVDQLMVSRNLDSNLQVISTLRNIGVSSILVKEVI